LFIQALYILEQNPGTDSLWFAWLSPVWLPPEPTISHWASEDGLLVSDGTNTSSSSVASSRQIMYWCQYTVETRYFPSRHFIAFPDTMFHTFSANHAIFYFCKYYTCISSKLFFGYNCSKEICFFFWHLLLVLHWMSIEPLQTDFQCSNHDLVSQVFIEVICNPLYEKTWWLYVLPQCLANVTQPIKHKESYIFTIFVPVLRTLSSLGLKIFDVSVHFYER